MTEPEIVDLETDPGRIRVYRWSGVGLPILCIHGFGGSGLDWEIVADHLQLGRNLIALDLPGHGSSYRPDSGEGGVEVILDVLEDLSRIFAFDKVDLLAYSMGARVALHWTLAHKHRIRRLALVGVTPGISEEGERRDRVGWDRQMASQARGMSSVEFAELWRRLPIISTQERMPEPWKSRMLARRRANENEALARTLEDLGTGTMSHLWDRLVDLDIPLTLVVGEEDSRYQAIAERVFQAIPENPSSKIIRISGAGHAVHLEKTQRFVEAISLFLGSD